MITIRFSNRTPAPLVSKIGMETDQQAEKLRFLLPQISDGQSAQLMLLLPDGTPEILRLVDGMALVPAAVCGQPGRSRAWVEILGSGGVAWNSEVFYLEVGDLPPISEAVEGKYPTALQDALDAAAQAVTLRNEAQAARDRAESAAAAIAGGGAAQSGVTQVYTVNSGESVTLPAAALAQNAPAAWETEAEPGAQTETRQYQIGSGESVTLPDTAPAQNAAVTWDTVTESGSSTSTRAYTVPAGSSVTLPATAQEQTVAVTWEAPAATGSFVNLARNPENMPLTLGSGYTQVASQCLADAVAAAYNAGDTYLFIGLYLEISGDAEVSVFKGENPIDSAGASASTITQSGWYYTLSGVLSGADATVNKFTLTKTGDGTAVIRYLYCQSCAWLNANASSVSWSTASPAERAASIAAFKERFSALEIVPGQDSGAQQTAARGSVAYNGSTTAYTSGDTAILVGPGAVISCAQGAMGLTVTLTEQTTWQAAGATVTLNGRTTAYTQAETALPVGPGAVIACTKGTLHLTALLDAGSDASGAGATVAYNGVTTFFDQSASSIPVGPGAVITGALGTLRLTVALAARSSPYPDWSGRKWACVGDSLTDTGINATRKYETILAEKTGIRVQMLGVGSTGYTAGADSGKAFAARCAQVDRDTDVVTLFGSVNDWKNYAYNSLCPVIGTAADVYDETKTWKENTFCANVNRTFDILFDRAPTAKVIVFGAMPYYGVGQEHFQEAREAVESVCRARHIPYVDMYDSTGFSRILTSAEYAKAYTWEGENAAWTGPGDYPSAFGHPNNRAHAEIIAPVFYEALRRCLPL